jgi:hypothetical protein
MQNRQLVNELMMIFSTYGTICALYLKQSRKLAEPYASGFWTVSFLLKKSAEVNF